MVEQAKVATNYNYDIAEIQLAIPFHLSLHLLSVMANHPTMEHIKHYNKVASWVRNFCKNDIYVTFELY